jgi:type III secretion system YscQ/HrcQ family protein
MHTPPARSRSIRPFPWDALPALSREAAGAMQSARRAVATAIDAKAVATALSELVGMKSRIDVTAVDVVTGDPSLGGAPLGSASLALGTADDEVRVRLDVDHELARTLVTRALGRPVTLGNPQKPLGPEIEGALLAIVLKVARRAHGTGAPLVPRGRGDWRASPGERRVRVDATVTLDRDAFAVRALVAFRKTLPVPKFGPRERLASLGHLPIVLPLVVAHCVVPASEVTRLAPGDVFLPGAGSRARLDVDAGRLVGEGALASPSGARAIAVKLGEEGEIVLLGETALPLDVEKKMQSSNSEQTATSEIALDVPLVVRVEVGAVSLTAAEWAAMSPGDVIALGRRVNEPVVLRIAGTEVARGELVDVEGEIGVRIRERVGTT